VETYCENGIPSSDWEGKVVLNSGVEDGGIRIEEWLMNPAAARKR
jgi:hypothetical protein